MQKNILNKTVRIKVYGDPPQLDFPVHPHDNRTALEEITEDGPWGQIMLGGGPGPGVS